MKTERLDENQIRARVLECLAAVAPDADLDRIRPTASFHDQFEIDSVDFLNLMLALERAFGVRIPEADYPRLSSLEGAVRCLQGEMAGAKS